MKITLQKGKEKEKSVKISAELFNLLCQHFRISDIPETYPEDEPPLEYNKREYRIKQLLTEKYNKTLIRNAYQKIIDAKTPEEKTRAEEFYKIVKKTLLE